MPKEKQTTQPSAFTCAAKKTPRLATNRPSPPSSRPMRTRLQMQRAEQEEVANQPNQPFRFLDLPPELRNSVYEYLSRGIQITIESYLSDFSRDYSQEDFYFYHEYADRAAEVGLPPLLATNRQLRNEAMSIFCVCTEWIIREERHLAPLLKNLGPERIAAMTSICYIPSWTIYHREIALEWQGVKLAGNIGRKYGKKLKRTIRKKGLVIDQNIIRSRYEGMMGRSGGAED